MAGFCLHFAVFIQLRLSGLLIHFKHLVGVSVVGGNNGNAVQRVHHRQDSAKLQIQRFHRATGRRKRTGMSNHIAVGEIDAQNFVFARLQTFNQLVGNLGALHPGALFKRNDVRGDFNVGFQLLVKLARFVSVPEIGHMPVFLRFGHSKHGNTGSGKIFAHGVGDFGRRDQIFFRNVQISVIFQHAGKFHIRNAHAVEFVKFACRSVKRAGNFNRAVTAEVIENHTVSVFDRSHRLAVLCNDERGQVLVNHVQFLAVGFHSLGGACKLPPLAQHMGLPTGGNHCPVCLVAVHGNLHSAAARSNANIKIRRAERAEKVLKREDVVQRRGLANVAPVQQDMHADFANALFFRFDQHGFEVVDVRMDIPIRKQTKEMERALVCLDVADQLLPGGGSEHFARLDRVGNQLCALRKYLPGAQSVVPDLAVTHIVVRGETDRGAVRFERNHGIFRHQPVKVGRIGTFHRIGNGIRRKTDAIHHNGQNRAFYSVKILIFQ